MGLVSTVQRDKRTPAITNRGRFGLPELVHCTRLADEADVSISADYVHRSGATQYPLIKLARKGQAVFRVRNLALGGPYQALLSYRREILGNLQSSKRCDVCLCIINNGKTVTTCADIRFCVHCLEEWTVRIQGNMDKNTVLKHVKTLLDDDLYRYQKVYSIWDSSVHPGFDSLPRRLLLPLVDHVMRDVLGIDYRTAKAKEAYLGRLRLSKNKDTKVMDARRQVRLNVVAAAERIYAPNQGSDMPAPLQPQPLAKYWSEAFLPVDRLQEVMFPPEDLDKAGLLIPMESNMLYPHDPTVNIRTCREAATLIEDRSALENFARTMLHQLMLTPSKFGKLVQIAVEYHVARLRSTLTVEGVKQAVEKISNNPMQNSPYRASAQVQYTSRFAGILAKLHLEPDDVTKPIKANDAFRHDALKTLPRILESACISCPATGYLARHGIEGVVKHVQQAHERLFWGCPQTGSQEDFFKIIG
jgi:hypothetical protein